MVEFKRPPGGEDTGATAGVQHYVMQASGNVPDDIGKPLFSDGQWMVIAIVGMGFSLLMMMAGMVFSWRKARRKRLAERGK